MSSLEYTAAVNREKQIRLEAYLPWALPLLGCPMAPLTWRCLIELSRAENAFFTSAEPTRDDVFDLLWRLNPAFRRPDGEYPNLNLLAIARGARRPSRLQSWAARVLLSRSARLLNANAVEFSIRTRLDEAFIDRPEPPKKKGEQEYISPLRSIPTWFDYVASEFGMWGHSRDEVLDYSVAWTFQMLRVQGIKAGREDDYIPPSAALYDDETVPFEPATATQPNT